MRLTTIGLIAGTLTLTLGAGSSLAQQQETLNQIQTAWVDAKGDAKMQVEFVLSAKAWINWKNQYGDHPDLLRRDLVHQFSMFVLEDFKLERDDLNRKATASMRVRGEARYRGDGKFEIVLPKTWNKITDTDGGREWHFSYSEIIGQGTVMNQSIKLILPEGITEPKLSPGLQGQQLLSYRLPTSPSKSSTWPVLMGVGLVGLLGTLGMRFTVWR